MVLSTALIYQAIDSKYGINPKFSKIVFAYPDPGRLTFQAFATYDNGKEIQISGQSTFENKRQRIIFNQP